MFRLFISILICLVLFSEITLSQQINSLQINGGIISPVGSSNGLSSSVQINYSINPDVNLYIYSGYSQWDKYNVTFLEELSEVQKIDRFKTYSANNHIMIPVYLGSKIDFHSNEVFTSFINIELGYSYLSYDSYKNIKSVDPETGEVLGYYADESTKVENKQHLFGLGIGLGISHQMTKNVNLVINYKLNSHINSRYQGLFSHRGTYSLILIGFNFKI